VYVKWLGAFVRTGILVDSMEEFVEVKVNKKYDRKIVRI
jgi:hypothetical protein